jgi:hypothetical protein
MNSGTMDDELRSGLSYSHETVKAFTDWRDERIEELESVLESIKNWCEAYPLDVFPEPDLEMCKQLLDDSLLTQLSAHNMRHVLTGIARIASQAKSR